MAFADDEDAADAARQVMEEPGATKHPIIDRRRHG